MEITLSVPDDVGLDIRKLPVDFNLFASQGLIDAVLKYKTVQDFVAEKTLTDVVRDFRKDHIDMIVLLKENGINLPSIQAYSENGFTQETEDAIDIASDEARRGRGLSREFGSMKEFLEDLNKESSEYKDEKNED